MQYLLKRLNGLVDAGTVLKMTGASLEDLQMLAAIEDHFQEEKK